MKQIKKGKEPNSLLVHRQKDYADYDNLVKDELRDCLLNEQSYICCYCMQRISKEKMKIEHWQPQSKYPERQLDYQNLLASCQGNDDKPKHFPRHCDTSKGDQEITINPADKLKNCEEFIKYRGDGRIYSDDPCIDRELNEVLNLNIPTLVNNREAVLNQVKKDIIKIKGKQAPWSPIDIKKKIQQFETKTASKYQPYCQVIIYFLRKRFAKELGYA